VFVALVGGWNKRLNLDQFQSTHGLSAHGLGIPYVSTSHLITRSKDVIKGDYTARHNDFVLQDYLKFLLTIRSRN